MAIENTHEEFLLRMHSKQIFHRFEIPSATFKLPKISTGTVLVVNRNKSND